MIISVDRMFRLILNPKFLKIISLHNYNLQRKHKEACTSKDQKNLRLVFFVEEI